MKPDLALITGASSDIGLALIRHLARSPNPPVILAHGHAGADRIEALRSALHSGHIHAAVEDRQRSLEFIGLLRRLNAYYPPEAIIRVVLDNHSAHISKETRAYLATRSGRFEYVHTPKHGSWLNLIECAFSKMARTFLRHIRVDSVDELKARILAGIAEFNDAPVVFRWNKFDLGLV